MSGKLIMKRKLSKERSQLQHMDTTTTDDTELYPTQSQSVQMQQNTMDESSNLAQNKRMRYDTSAPECDCGDNNLTPPQLDDVSQENFLNIQGNRNLLEAIQAKMLELQQELDEFEQDFEAYEDDLYNGHAPPSVRVQMSEQEAEALGYAMCAQETMLFLHREGVPSDSLLYTRLYDALVGRSETDGAFHVGAHN